MSNVLFTVTVRKSVAHIAVLIGVILVVLLLPGVGVVHNVTKNMARIEFMAAGDTMTFESIKRPPTIWVMRATMDGMFGLPKDSYGCRAEYDLPITFHGINDHGRQYAPISVNYNASFRVWSLPPKTLIAQYDSQLGRVIFYNL